MAVIRAANAAGASATWILKLPQSLHVKTWSQDSVVGSRTFKRCTFMVFWSRGVLSKGMWGCGPLLSFCGP